MTQTTLVSASEKESLSPSQQFLLAKGIPQKLSQIASAWECCQHSTNSDDTVNLLIMVDSLCGYCAGHGFIAVKEEAIRLNDFVQKFSTLGVLTSTNASEFADLLKGIRDAAKLTAEGRAVAQTKDKRQTQEEEDVAHKVIHVYTSDELAAGEISLQVSHYGYTTHIFKPSQMFAEPSGQRDPVSAILIDFDCLDRAQTKPMKDLAALAGVAPIIAISSKQDFDARIDAIRNGATSYFVKPLNVATLVDKIEEISATSEREPYKIMIMDDSKTASRSIEKALLQGGIDVHIVANHKQVLRELAEFHPDLILMDMYMDGCNGNEVASIIRQNEAHVSIPIVYLSSETDVTKQLEAMRHGADDFLTKPIRPEHLILSVTNKIERYRLIRKFMTRDSLTGLLNHTKTKQRLDIAVSKAAREGGVLSFAMIDIDHFKKVNDTYGHPVGDRVIKSLAMLLQQRLRKTDIIGRYGGEEFAVVLTGTPLDHAKTIFDRIRGDFELVYHHYDDCVFNVTISIGLASFPDFPDAAAIGVSADKALYRAKKGGRNRVMTATKES